jgi:hypothetical protein
VAVVWHLRRSVGLRPLGLGHPRYLPPHAGRNGRAPLRHDLRLTKTKHISCFCLTNTRMRREPEAALTPCLSMFMAKCLHWL